MIRIKPARRFRVSNRLALVGALTLALTLFTGVNDTREADMQSARLAAVELSSQDEVAGPDDRRKRFSISRLLFGHG